MIHFSAWSPGNGSKNVEAGVELDLPVKRTSLASTCEVRVAGNSCSTYLVEDALSKRRSILGGQNVLLFQKTPQERDNSDQARSLLHLVSPLRPGNKVAVAGP